MVQRSNRINPDPQTRKDMKTMNAITIDKLTDTDLRDYIALYQEHAANIGETMVLYMLLETAAERQTKKGHISSR